MKKVILVGVNINNDLNFNDSLEELNGLVKALNYEVVGVLTQNLKIANKQFLIGPGKIELLKNFANEHQANLIVFDQELSPIQNKNLEENLKIEVIDRTLLILNIFSLRAKSKEAKLQVEAARLSYLLPRLAITNANYEQQGGGSFHNKGSGEKQIDLDKRILKNKISLLNKELNKLAIAKQTQRKARDKNAIPLVCLVGYTNAGKSTLMNTFINKYNTSKEKEVFTKDMLFATLDTSTRLIKLKDKRQFLLSDTVGFIANLPTLLVDSFKSTLEEITHADLILIVSDISSPDVDKQNEVTINTLKEIGIDNNIPIINVYNKADKLKGIDFYNNEKQVFISAKKNINIDLLEQKIRDILFKDEKEYTLFFPYSNGKEYATFLKNAIIKKTINEENGIKVIAILNKNAFNEYYDFIDINI